MAIVQLGTKAIGSIVKIMVGGVYRNFIVVHKGRPSNTYDVSFEGTVWLLSKDVLENVYWYTGSANDYANSTVNSYLQNTFIRNIEQPIRDSIVQVKLPYKSGNGGSASPVRSGADGLPAKLFLLSGVEVGYGYTNFVDGKKLDYFSLSNGPNSVRIGYLNGKVSPWFLRTPSHAATAYDVWHVMEDGDCYVVWAFTLMGLRPAFVLPQTICVKDDGALTTAQPPTAPGSIAYDGKARAGKSVVITCGASTSPDGASIQYVWEHHTDTGVYSQISIGGTNTTATVPTSGTLYQARVKAVDSRGLESGYHTGEAVTISYNDPPVITDEVEGGDLGDLTDTGISHTYTVTDDKDENIEVGIAIDGKTVCALTAPAGEPQTFTLAGDEWQRVLNGDHTLTVTATDSDGESTLRNLTFSRSQSVLEFMMRAAKQTDSRPYRMAFSLSGELPDGVDAQILACNNGFDELPAWEDITQAVTLGRAHVFTNDSKTADHWGLNIHVRIDRDNAPGECYVTGFVLSFDTDGSDKAQVMAMSVQMENTEQLLDTLLTEILPGMIPAGGDGA